MVDHTNQNFIKQYINDHRGMHRKVEERTDQWTVHHDNRSYIKSHVNRHKGMHRMSPEKVDKWHIDHDNKNFIAGFLNEHKGMHRHNEEPERQWDVFHNNQSYVRALVNAHKGAYRTAPEPAEKWHVNHDNKSYITTHVNQHKGMHRLSPEKAHQWTVDADNKNYIAKYINDHQGMHRHGEEPEQQWDVHHNNQSYITTFINDHKGAYRDIPEPAEKWHVEPNNQSYINTHINQQKGMHRIAPEGESKWQVDYDNKNFVKTVINDHSGNHRHAVSEERLWEVDYDNRNFVKTALNDHLGRHRNAVSEEKLWEVDHAGNRDFIRSYINHHKGMHMKVPDVGRKWEVTCDNKNYIGTYLNNDHIEAYRDIPDIKNRWEVRFDNRNYIKSCVNRERGLHRIPSSLLDINVPIENARKSDVDVVNIGKGQPHDLFKMKYDKKVKILKGGEITSVQDLKEEEESNAEYDSGFAFLQDDVPHVSSPLLKKVSRGGYRFHGVVRNIYDYDISEEDLAKQIQLHPQYMRRTKSKEYQKPGTTRVGFDTDESSWESSMRGETDSSGETIVQGEDRSATSEDLVIQHIPGISPSTKDTLSYYQGQAKQNASSKWQQPTDISPQSSSYMQGMPKKSTPGVADTLSYFQDKVAPKQQRKKTADVEETLSYFHQKVAPKQPVAGIPSQVKKQEISEQVQGTLLQYQQHGAQQGAVPKLKPTTQVETLERLATEEAYIAETITDSNAKKSAKRIEKVDSDWQESTISSSTADSDDHRSHANDHGIKHQNQYEEFSTDKGRELYMVSEEKYSELHHSGKFKAITKT